MAQNNEQNTENHLHRLYLHCCFWCLNLRLQRRPHRSRQTKSQPTVRPELANPFFPITGHRPLPKSQHQVPTVQQQKHQCHLHLLVRSQPTNEMLLRVCQHGLQLNNFRFLALNAKYLIITYRHKYQPAFIPLFPVLHYKCKNYQKFFIHNI